MAESRDKSDEMIIYMDKVGDKERLTEPLTYKPLAPKTISRSGSMLETDNINNPRPTSGPEIDDLEPAGSFPTGFDPRIGIDDGLLPSEPGVSEIPRTPFLPSPSMPPIQPIPDVNIYQHKKTLAQGMMDLALLSANANQLRYVLQTDGGHPYYYPSLVLIGSSLILQIAVGIGLIWNSRYDVNDNAQMCKANRANNWTVIDVSCPITWSTNCKKLQLQAIAVTVTKTLPGTQGTGQLCTISRTYKIAE